MKEPVQVYLSRRNLQTLLNKLDRTARGDKSACTIIKHDTEHPTMPQSHRYIAITAVEDKDYYFEREPGGMYGKDAPKWQSVKAK